SPSYRGGFGAWVRTLHQTSLVRIGRGSRRASERGQPAPREPRPPRAPPLHRRPARATSSPRPSGGVAGRASVRRVPSLSCPGLPSSLIALTSPSTPGSEDLPVRRQRPTARPRPTPRTTGGRNTINIPGRDTEGLSHVGSHHHSIAAGVRPPTSPARLH